MSYEEARDIALEHINERNKYSREKLVMQEELTINSEFCWVFFYQFEKYLKTGEFRDMAMGNAPILISKCDGSMYATGTAHPIRYYIERFEKKCRDEKSSEV